MLFIKTHPEKMKDVLEYVRKVQPETHTHTHTHTHTKEKQHFSK